MLKIRIDSDQRTIVEARFKDWKTNKERVAIKSSKKNAILHQARDQQKPELSYLYRTGG